MINRFFVIVILALLLLNQSPTVAFRSFRQPISFPTSQIQTAFRHSNQFAHFSSPALENKIEVVEPFGRGLKNDLSRKIPFYVSDFRDGFRLKTLSSTVFLFFACLAPAVAFGGKLEVYCLFFLLFKHYFLCVLCRSPHYSNRRHDGYSGSCWCHGYWRSIICFVFGATNYNYWYNWPSFGLS